MKEFEYHQPRSLQETFALLKDHGDDARLIAGGTGLLLFMKQRLAQPDHLISLAKVPGMDYIREENGELRVGALCTQRTAETSPVIHERIPLISETFRRVATPRIRNMSTVGGGLVHGDPNQDPPPSLLALNGSVVLKSESGERIVPLDNFFLDYYETDVAPGEVLTELRVPIPPPNTSGVFLKFLPRTADDYATVSASAVLHMTEGDVCQDVRVVVGSAGPIPVRATETENALKGQRLTDQLLRTASEAVHDAVSPLDDFRGSAGYKRDMAVVFTRRALEQAWHGPGAGS